MQVDASRTSQAPREFNATLKDYQYGNVCFTPTPPAGSTAIENSNPGLPSVSQRKPLFPQHTCVHLCMTGVAFALLCPGRFASKSATTVVFESHPFTRCRIRKTGARMRRQFSLSDPHLQTLPHCTHHTWELHITMQRHPQIIKAMLWCMQLMVAAPHRRTLEGLLPPVVNENT